MSAGQLGALVGAFGLSLLCAIVAKWIAELLRAKISVRYGVASAAAFLPLLAQLPIGGPEPIHLLGALLALVVILWWSHRAKTAEAKRAAAEDQGTH